MKSFNQIAKAMYEAFVKQTKQTSPEAEFQIYAQMGKEYQSCWIAAAQAAHKELMGVH